MKHYELHNDRYLCSTDTSKLDIAYIYNYLRNSYWAKDREYDIVKHSITNSLCFGLYDESQQIGFARVVSDYSIFAYLADVFVDEKYRGKGLGKWLIKSICEYPQLKNVNRFVLATKDAHGLYAQFGFSPIEDPKLYMVKQR